MACPTPSRSRAAAIRRALRGDRVVALGRFVRPAVPEQVDPDDAMGRGQQRTSGSHVRVEEPDPWMSRRAGASRGPSWQT